MSTCTRFAKCAETYTSIVMSMNAVLDEETADMVTPGQKEEIQKAMALLNKLEEGFIHHMKFLIEALNLYSATETVRFLCLVVRLDYNQFYANQRLNVNFVVQ